MYLVSVGRLSVLLVALAFYAFAAKAEAACVTSGHGNAFTCSKQSEAWAGASGGGAEAAATAACRSLSFGPGDIQRIDTGLVHDAFWARYEVKRWNCGKPQHRGISGLSVEINVSYAYSTADGQCPASELPTFTNEPGEYWSGENFCRAGCTYEMQCTTGGTECAGVQLPGESGPAFQGTYKASGGACGLQAVNLSQPPPAPPAEGPSPLRCVGGVCHDGQNKKFCSLNAQGQVSVCVDAPGPNTQPPRCEVNGQDMNAKGICTHNYGTPPPTPPPPIVQSPPPTVSTQTVTYVTNNTSNTTIHVTTVNNSPPGTPPEGTCTTPGGCDGVPPGTCTNPAGCGGNPPGTCSNPAGCAPPSTGSQEPLPPPGEPPPNAVPPGTCMNPAGCASPTGPTPAPPGTCVKPGGCGPQTEPPPGEPAPPVDPPGTCEDVSGCGPTGGGGGGPGGSTAPGACSDPNGCNGGSAQPGTCMRPGGCSGTPPGNCTNPAGCGTDGQCDPQTEECGEDGVASGGVSCDAPPSCSGDQILCNVLFQQHQTRCAIEAFGGGEEVDPGEGVTEADTAATTLRNVEIGAADLDATGFGGGSCPQLPTLSIGGQEVQIDGDFWCQFLSVVNAVLTLAAVWIAAQILMGKG